MIASTDVVDAPPCEADALEALLSYLSMAPATAGSNASIAGASAMDVLGVLPRETLLVHFSFGARGIAERGFRYGVSRAADTRLVTSEIPISLKPGGYNFAYRTDWEDETVRWTDGELAVEGMDAVLFRAAGVMVDHYQDAERQLIFWGAAVRHADIVLLEREGDLDLWRMPSGLTGSYAECVAAVLLPTFPEAVDAMAPGTTTRGPV